jgi:putative transcriptional regulator
LNEQEKIVLHVAGINCHLGELLERRGMTLSQLSETVGISLANLSILKTNKGKAVRFSSLVAICRALNCDVGDLLSLNQSNQQI